MPWYAYVILTIIYAFVVATIILANHAAHRNDPPD